MKHLLIFLAVLSLFALACENIPSAYDQRYQSCELQANQRNLVGNERRAFMDGCMQGYTNPGNTPTQADCEMEANRRNLIGPNRQAFINSCMQGQTY